MSVSFRSQEPYIIWLWFMVNMCKMMISSKFFYFSKFWFLGGKRAKNDLKLPVSVCYALYLRNCRSYHWDFLKNATLQILKLFCFLLAHINNFFNDYLFFKFINNARKKFWDVPHLLYMHVIFSVFLEYH